MEAHATDRRGADGAIVVAGRRAVLVYPAPALAGCSIADGGHLFSGRRRGRWQGEQPMDLGLKGKKAIVTGATRGIGRAIANLLAAEGCDVAICARHKGGVDEAVAA